MSLSKLREQWQQQAQEQAPRKPVPTGEYVCVAECGEKHTASTGREGYKVQFRIIEGPHAGSRLWWRGYFGDKCGPRTAADLAKLGIVEDEQLDRPLPAGMTFRVFAIETMWNGNPSNDVKKFDRVAHIAPRPDPFADVPEPVVQVATVAQVQPVAPVASSHTLHEADPDTDEVIPDDVFMEEMRLMGTPEGAALAQVLLRNHIREMVNQRKGAA